jgi:hypothetical protein
MRSLYTCCHCSATVGRKRQGRDKGDDDKRQGAHSRPTPDCMLHHNATACSRRQGVETDKETKSPDLLQAQRPQQPSMSRIIVDAENACSYFEHLVEYQVAVCRECRHGVVPSHIESHLQRVHKVEYKEAGRVAEAVGGWTGLVHYASEVQMPSAVAATVAQLPIYADGLLCRLEPGCCSRVVRSAEAMKKHWREVHDWSVAGRRGRSSRVARQRIQRRSIEEYRAVHCQRLFVQGPSSQYFEDEVNP